MKIPNELTRNFSDINVRRELIRKYGGHPLPFSGINENGENVLVSIDKERGIVVRCFQQNGWVRVNTYDKDGLQIAEAYEGRWKEAVQA